MGIRIWAIGEGVSSGRKILAGAERSTRPRDDDRPDGVFCLRVCSRQTEFSSHFRVPSI